MHGIARKVMIPLRSSEIRERPSGVALLCGGRARRACSMSATRECRASDMPGGREARSDLLILRPVEILWTSSGIPVDKLSAAFFFSRRTGGIDRTAHCVCGFVPTFA
jgi:hypothetical protein